MTAQMATQTRQLKLWPDRSPAEPTGSPRFGEGLVPALLAQQEFGDRCERIGEIVKEFLRKRQKPLKGPER